MVTARRGMVAASNPLAAQAGVALDRLQLPWVPAVDLDRHRPLVLGNRRGLVEVVLPGHARAPGGDAAEHLEQGDSVLEKFLST